MNKFAASLEVSLKQLKFVFDGDPVKPSMTAEQCDMEDEDTIDAL